MENIDGEILALPLSLYVCMKFVFKIGKVVWGESPEQNPLK